MQLLTLTLPSPLPSAAYKEVAIALPPRRPADDSETRAFKSAAVDSSVPQCLLGHDVIDASPATGTAVNSVSRAVLPREQFPLHFDYMIRDLYRRGINPATWQIIAGDEVRLDEDGMDVEFTMLENGTDTVWRRRVNIHGGRLVSIIER